MRRTRFRKSGQQEEAEKSNEEGERAVSDRFL